MADTVDVKVPTIGESITSAFIGRWRKQPGEAVAKGEPIVEVDSDKANLEVPAPAAGVLAEQLAAEGDEVQIGAVIARISVGEGAAAEPAAKEPAAEEPAAEEAPAGPDGKKTRSGPAARQAAAELGVDIEGVTGSGRGGRVLRADVEAAASKAPEAAPQEPAAKEPSAPEPAAKPASGGDGRVERVRMTPLRRTIARRLVEAQQTAAMLTTFNEVDMSHVMALRKRHQERFQARHGLKLGFMSFFVKAAIEALKQYPSVNASIDGSDILYKRYYNVGVAVSTDRGLVVPVVRDADRLSFAEIEKAIGQLGEKARQSKLTPEDFQDGTFTISNGGVFGSLMSTPILNPPQVGILGMHAIQERPVGVEGQIVLRPMMYLALSYDHRIIDGREAVSFLVRIKELVESPERILLEV